VIDRQRRVHLQHRRKVDVHLLYNKSDRRERRKISLRVNVDQIRNVRVLKTRKETELTKVSLRCVSRHVRVENCELARNRNTARNMVTTNNNSGRTDTKQTRECVTTLSRLEKPLAIEERLRHRGCGLGGISVVRRTPHRKRDFINRHCIQPENDSMFCSWNPSIAG
jgi:hypothetical protein